VGAADEERSDERHWVSPAGSHPDLVDAFGAGVDTTTVALNFAKGSPVDPPPRRSRTLVDSLGPRCGWLRLLFFGSPRTVIANGAVGHER